MMVTVRWRRKRGRSEGGEEGEVEERQECLITRSVLYGREGGGSGRLGEHYGSPPWFPLRRWSRPEDRKRRCSPP